jgi:hypothetical protein
VGDGSAQQKKKPGTAVPGFLSYVCVLYSAKEDIMVAGTVGQYRRIDNFSTRAALPCIESTNKIIILLSIHATFTLGTSHSNSSLFNKSKYVVIFLNVSIIITRAMPSLH